MQQRRLATWDEMDLDAGVWTIPAARMKAKRDHRVPLSSRALAILHDVQRLSDGTGLVFRSLRGKPLSTVTLSKLIKVLGIAAVLHGFRSSFRDWAAERTNTPREVVEAALAHTVQNPTEAAYARSDLFERRRRLMDDGIVKLTKSSSIDPQDTGLQPAVNPPCWASRTAVGLNLTIPCVERTLLAVNVVMALSLFVGITEGWFFL